MTFRKQHAPLKPSPTPSRAATLRSSRRLFLRGVGGAAVALPLLEGLRAGPAQARDAVQADPFALYFRQPNGVASAQSTDEIGAEPERFWPTQLGALTPDTVNGRALDELTAYLDRTLVVGNINYNNFDYGDGHARGALQALTGVGPVSGTYVGDSEADGQSIDMFIAENVNPGGADSLFLYAGLPYGWLGGSCVSYRSAGVRHASVRNPYTAFQNLFMGVEQGDPNAIVVASRRRAVNDLVREQMQRLMAHPRLSSTDQSRLSDHFDAIRDVEVAIMCQQDAAEEAELMGASAYIDDPTGDNLKTHVALHGKVAALAIACGLTRSVVIQVGNGNGSGLRFTDPDNGQLMENFHFISHRRSSHDSNGTVIAGSDVLHHKIDRHFGQMFKSILDSLDAFDMPDGTKLLDAGVCAWYNDQSNGPQHCAWDAPWVFVGGCGGQLKQGEYIDAVERTGGGPQCSRSPAQAPPTLGQMHNTIATAVGCTNEDGSPIDDFGHDSLPGGRLDSMLVGG